MKILTFHLIRSVALSSLAGIGVFVFILITGNALRDILGLFVEGYLPLHFLRDLILLLVPAAFSFAMPLGVLIAILLVMGRLSANQELTALRAAGISLWSIAAPVLFVALCGSALAAYINAVHAPTARATYRAILNDLIREDPLRFIVPRAFIHDFPGYVLYVGEKEDDRMRQFWLWELDAQERAVRLLRAEEGSFAFDESKDALILTLREGFTELRDASDPDNLQDPQPTLTFRDATIRLPLANLLGAANKPRRAKDFTLAELLERRARAAFDLAAAADPEAAARARVEYHTFQYYISRHFAMAFSVFSLALFAIPLGIVVGRTETYANFVIALAVSMTYYFAVIILGLTVERPALRPELLVWLPNLFAQGLGFWLLRRAAAR